MTALCTKLWLDSIDMTTHDNNNPFEWNVSLNRVVHNVSKVSLTQLHVPTSPYHILTRASKWYDSTQTALDSFHNKVVALERTFQAGTNNAVVLSATDGTATLNVHRIYTAVELGKSNDFRTVDCFLTTGTNNYSSGSGATWNLSDQDDVSSPFSTTADDGTYGAPQAVGTITITTFVQPVDYILKLRINGSFVRGAHGQLSTSVAQRWRSYRWYRPGEIVSDGLQRFECVEDHQSIIFGDDKSNKLWRALPTDGTIIGRGTRPAEGAFVILTMSDDNESTAIQRVSSTTYTLCLGQSTTVNEIGVQWIDSSGNPVLFPIEAQLKVLSFDTTAPVIATSRNFYKPHKLMLEFS
jgi:hypothetical protein